MRALFRTTLAAVLSTAASIALAQPSTGIDLSNLTPKTPSQKAAADANASSTTGSQSSTQKSSGPIGGPFAPGAFSNASSSAPNSTAAKDVKPGTGLLKSPFGNNAKSTPTASDDTPASSTDVQVKIPKK